MARRKPRASPSGPSACSCKPCTLFVSAGIAWVSSALAVRGQAGGDYGLNRGGKSSTVTANGDCSVCIFRQQAGSDCGAMDMVFAASA